MALGVVNFYRHKPRPSFILGLVSFILSIFLCIIMYWWMIDTVVYLKWEVLKSPLLNNSVREQIVLPT
jgi:heme/copper-type cytochrome/quinol oxidase subunit 4